MERAREASGARGGTRATRCGVGCMVRRALCGGQSICICTGLLLQSEHGQSEGVDEGEADELSVGRTLTHRPAAVAMSSETAR